MAQLRRANRQEILGFNDGHLRCLDFCRSFRTAVDGGAHRGIWFKELNQRFEKVVGFEPRECMSKLINGYCVTAALGETYGWCGIQEGEENDGQAFVSEGRKTQVYPLDWFMLDDVDFIKLDVEGYELMALKGAERTINHSKPLLLIEQNGLSERYGYTDKDLVAWLSERGYEEVGVWNKDHAYRHRLAS